jgi:hypothetical protein
MSKPRHAVVPRLVIVVLVLASFRCAPSGPQLAGSQSTGFGSATRLDTQFHIDEATKQEVPLVQVLFVPQWDVPEGGGFGTSGGHGGTRKLLELDYSYHELGSGSAKRRIDSQRIRVVDGETLEAQGRVFHLSAGNVFVVDVNEDGTVQVTQVPSASQARDASPPAVLALIQKSLPAGHRVQRLRADGRTAA